MILQRRQYDQIGLVDEFVYSHQQYNVRRRRVGEELRISFAVMILILMRYSGHFLVRLTCLGLIMFIGVGEGEVDNGRV